jgi:hypothetical protein
MLCSTLVTFCALNIAFYQRTLLGTSANQKRHYLKSYNNTFYFISEGRVEYYILMYFRRACGILRFIVFQKVMWNIAFYCISKGHVEYYVLLYFRRACGILRFTVF